MEENSEIREDLSEGGKFKNWLQDNIRIILSVLIVATIAAGIYSYSQRTVVPAGEIDSSAEINLAEADIEEENGAVVVVGEDDQDNKIEKTEDNQTEELSVENVENDAVEVVTSEDNKEAEKEEIAQPEEKKVVEEVVEEVAEDVAEKVEVVEVSSEETKGAFTETANRGDSLTTLARQAVKHYLEKNPTEGLSAEHKIYMEDYLRKQLKHSKVVSPGEKISFSKDLIGQAVGAAKTLNEHQLKNLQKYSTMVRGL